MGVSDVKQFPLSTPTKPCSKLTSSVEAKENHLKSPNLTNQKKSSSKKNFMSPTISAASKAVIHRKKVLAERNGGEATEPAFAKLLHRRSSSYDLQQGSAEVGAAVNSSTDSLTSRVREMLSVEDGGSCDESKPYDPVFNYCSPRPKFLLYKPDRRSEILRRYEMVESTSSESEAGSESDESLVKPAEEVTENAGGFYDHKAEETIAQPDVEVDKITPEHVEEEIHERAEECVEDAPERIEEHVHEAQHVDHQSLKNKTCEALGTEKVDDCKILSLEIDEGEFEKDEVERGWSLKRLLKLWFVIVAVGLTTLYLSSMNSPSLGLEDEDWAVRSVLHGAPFGYENASVTVIQGEMAGMGFEEANLRMMDGIVFRDHDNDIAENTDGSQEEYRGRVSDDEASTASCIADQIEATKDGTDSELTEVVHYAARETVAEDAGDTVDEKSVDAEENAPEDHYEVTETAEPGSQAGEASFAEMDGVPDANDHTEEISEESVVVEDSTGEDLEAGDRVMESSEALTDSGNDETVNNLDEAEAASKVSAPDLMDELTPINVTQKATIFSFVSALLLALLGALGFQKLKRTTTTKPSTKKAGVADQDASIGQHRVKQVDPSDYLSLSQSFKSGLGAPRVELLGEFTVGEQEVSSYSLRTGCVENREDITHSFSQRNMRMSAKQHASTTPADSHPAASGFSSTTDSPPYGSYSSQRRSARKEFPTSSIDSPSYGSLTTELMLRKKEEAGGLDKVVVTPVRRSSRIRSRTTPGASQ